MIVERLVRVQLRAMGGELFALGIRREGGEMILREGQRVIDIEKAIKWLRHENAKGTHIYIRPLGPHALRLIDDRSAEAIERMEGEGFEPAVVVETSPNNFQACLNHGQVLDAATSTRAAKQLVERFDGDPSIIVPIGGILGGWRGLPIRSANGVGLGDAAIRTLAVGYRACLLEDARVSGSYPSQRGRPENARRSHRSGATLKERLKSERLVGFHRDLVYGGDLHRADMAWP